MFVHCKTTIEKEGATGIPNDMGASQKQCAEQKKPDTKEDILCNSIYKKFYNNHNYSVVINIKSVFDWSRE